MDKSKMVYVRYSVVKRSSGKVIYINSGWFNSKEEANAYLKRQYGTHPTLIAIINK